MNQFYYYYSLICTISFLFGSLVFFCVYNSVSGGIWAACAGCLAGIYFQLHRFYVSNRLQHFLSFKLLEHMAIISFTICLIGWMFTVWYTFAILYWKIPLKPYDESLVFPCVFSFLTGKWGFHLHSAVKVYSKDFTSSNYSPLIHNV